MPLSKRTGLPILTSALYDLPISVVFDELLEEHGNPKGLEARYDPWGPKGATDKHGRTLAQLVRLGFGRRRNTAELGKLEDAVGVPGVFDGGGEWPL